MAGTYIDIDDLNNVFGTINITAWSDLTGGRITDTDRVDRGIAWAEKRIENRFRGDKYSVPFVAVGGTYDETLTHWMAVLAGDWLYKSRKIRQGVTEADTDRNSALRARVDEEIKETLGSRSRLDAGLVDSSAPSAPHVVTG